MRDLLGRLRAAISIPVLFALLLAAALLLLVQGENMESGNMTKLEARVSRALSGVEGVGQVDVVIRTRVVTTQGTGLTGQTQLEEVPCGAIAVAKGADDPLVKARLTQALGALLGLSAADVDVLSTTGGG